MQLWVGGGMGCSLAVGCVRCLFRLFCVTLFLPKAACHGGDVSDDSWLKWHSTLLTVLRHSRILVDAIDWIDDTRTLLQCDGNQGRGPCQKYGMASQNFIE